MVQQQHLEWLVVQQISPDNWIVLKEFHKKREAKAYRRTIKQRSLHFIYVEVLLRHQLIGCMVVR